MMKELYRICRDGAEVLIDVPHPRHDDFLNDPTHVRVITPHLLMLVRPPPQRPWQAMGASNSPLAHYLGVDFALSGYDCVLVEPYATQYADGLLGKDAHRQHGPRAQQFHPRVPHQDGRPQGRLTRALRRPSGRLPPERARNNRATCFAQGLEATRPCDADDWPLVDPAGFNRLRMCRTGPIVYNRFDRYVGASLHRYGEFSHSEQALFEVLVGRGQVVVEVGANIGAHTVVLSRLVGADGEVHAFEPQRIVFQALCANLALNQCTNVWARQMAVGSENASSCPRWTRRRAQFRRRLVRRRAWRSRAHGGAGRLRPSRVSLPQGGRGRDGGRSPEGRAEHDRDVSAAHVSRK